MAAKVIFSLVALTGFLSCAQAGERVPPNILFVLLDDLGWNDVGFRNEQFKTPTIDAMYNKGIRFDKAYTTPNCGPSRAALLSGAYPFRFGVQGNAINSRSSAAVPAGKKLLPFSLKKYLNYQTHLIGKWHQGFCKKSQLPTSRGFDTFHGFYLTKQDHFTHYGKKGGYDFRTNEDVNRSVEGQYSTYVYSERARQLIREYKDYVDAEKSKANPFFILLSYAAIHGPNQVPQHYIDDHCKKVDGSDRQIKCGMMAAVDEGLRNITDDLKSRGLMDNTLIVFTSDDGGKVEDGSSNWPLRGSKRTMWEGGIRVNTFMYSESRNVLPKTDFTWNGMFYITDFYATLLGIAKDDTKKKRFSGVVDSFNHWTFLKEGNTKKSYRKVFYHIDEDVGTAYIRHNKFKLIINQSRDSGWYNPPPGVKAPEEPDRDDLADVALFNIDLDPTETKNLATKSRFKARVASMKEKLDKMIKISVPPIHERLESSPRHFDGLWSSGWCSKKDIAAAKLKAEEKAREEAEEEAERAAKKAQREAEEAAELNELEPEAQ